MLFAGTAGTLGVGAASGVAGDFRAPVWDRVEVTARGAAIAALVTTAGDADFSTSALMAAGAAGAAGRDLPKSLDNATKSAKSILPLPLKSSNGLAAADLPKLLETCTKSAKATVPEPSESPGRTLKSKTNGDAVPSPDGNWLPPSVQAPLRSWPSAFCTVAATSSLRRSAAMGVARVQVAV